MRQRKIRNLDEKLAVFSGLQVSDPAGMRGAWEKPCYIEIGCGKGQFVTSLARKHPDWNILAFEGHRSVALHAMEKVKREKHERVAFILRYINNFDDVFEDGEVSGIFLNFSDPWPKARHEKRRLTCGAKLKEYARILKCGGILEFKTDNDDFFEYTLGELASEEMLETVEVSRDLHVDFDKEDIITTEYEDKFSRKGKNINYVKMRKV